MAKDFDRDYGHHGPETDADRDAHARIRAAFRRLAEELEGALPASRELSIVHTELETAHAWAHAALARGRFCARRS